MLLSSGQVTRRSAPLSPPAEDPFSRLDAVNNLNNLNNNLDAVANEKHGIHDQDQ